MTTMDSAARAIDMMLHRGRAEERDGGVWLDDLAARYVGDLRDCAEERDAIALELREEKAWSEAVTRKCETHRKQVLAISNVLDGKGRMSDKLAVIQQIVDGRTDVLPS